MGDLVDSLVRVFEFLIQGFLAVFVVGYVLIWFHPVKRALSIYIRAIHQLLIEGWKLPELKLPTAVAPIVLIGLVYFLGILTNVIGYWILEPVHHLAILDADRVYSVANDQTAPKKPASHKLPSFAATALLPLKWIVGEVQAEDQEITYANYLRQEVRWRNCNLEALSHALDPHIKQFRVIRGTIVCSLAICIVSLLKSLHFTLIWVLLRRRRSRPWVDWLYEHTVDPISAQSVAQGQSPLTKTLPAAGPARVESGLTSEDQPKRSSGPDDDLQPEIRVFRLRQTRKYALAALTVFGLALGLYLLSLKGWHTAEMEYHLMVRFGSETCPVTDHSSSSGH